MPYDDYKPSSNVSWGKDGRRVTRTLYIRADTEIDALYDPLCPQRGDALPIEFGSVTLETLYCSEVSVTQVPSAAGDSTGLFLWEVTAVWSPLTFSNPTMNKASWDVSFRPQQYLFKEVTVEANQTHYPATVPAGWPAVTTGINVTSEGPQGVEVDEMVEVLTLTFWKSPSDATTFLDTVRALKDKVNSAAFSGPWGTYAALEARITGVGVSRATAEMASVKVEISRSENKASFSVHLDSDNSTQTVTKNGWEYFWIRSLKSAKSSDNDVKPMSIDAHVAKIYASGDFSTLGVTSGIFI